MAGTAQAHEYKAGAIFVGHPWSPPAPVGAKVLAGYMAIKNSGSEADRLIAVSSEIAGKTEIHEMNVDPDGVMTMRQLKDGIEIPAGGEVELTPGGFHVMFMNVKTPPKTGDRFKGTVQFEHAGKLDVEFAVETKADADKHASHGG